MRKNDPEHEFVLVLNGIGELTEDIENALFAAGCDDATINVRSGQVFLTFSRRGASLKDAILSAIKDVRKANIGADVLRVDSCGIVTQSEIARRIGRTRQLVHQYITGERGPGGFPPPTYNVSDDSPFWSWRQVSRWLSQNDMIQADVAREAQEIDMINNVLEFSQIKQLEPKLAAEIVRTLK
jgi:hypothetical protein